LAMNKKRAFLKGFIQGVLLQYLTASTLYYFCYTLIFCGLPRAIYNILPILPLFLLILEVHKWQNRKYENLVVKIASLTTLIPAFIFQNQISLFWSVHAYLEYAVFFITYLFIFDHKIRNIYHALLLSALTICAIGFIYEIPLFLAKIDDFANFHFISPLYPFAIRPQILCTALLLFRLRRYKINLKIVVPLLVVYLIWSAIYAFNEHTFHKAIPRLPTFMLFLALAFSIEKLDSHFLG